MSAARPLRRRSLPIGGKACSAKVVEKALQL
jgi:hypothetical protein